MPKRKLYIKPSYTSSTYVKQPIIIPSNSSNVKPIYSTTTNDTLKSTEPFSTEKRTREQIVRDRVKSASKNLQAITALTEFIPQLRYPSLAINTFLGADDLIDDIEKKDDENIALDAVGLMPSSGILKGLGNYRKINKAKAALKVASSIGLTADLNGANLTDNSQKMKKKKYVFGGFEGGEEDGKAAIVAPRKVTTVPQGYMEEPIDPAYPNRKYYRKSTQAAQVVPTVRPASVRPMQNRRIGTGTSSKKIIPSVAPSTSQSLDRIYLEPEVQQVIPPVEDNFMGDVIFDTNKHAVGRLRNRNTRLVNRNVEGGTMDTGLEDAEFMYTIPDTKGSPVDTKKGKFKLNTKQLQAIFGTTNTMNTDVAEYLSKQQQPATASTFAEGGVVSPYIGMATSVLSGLSPLLDNRDITMQADQQDQFIKTLQQQGNPYSYAMGGTVDDLDEEELAQLQEEADNQGITVEELLELLQAQQQEEEVLGNEEYQPEEEYIDKEEEQSLADAYSEDDPVSEYAMGGVAPIKFKFKGDTNSFNQMINPNMPLDPNQKVVAPLNTFNSTESFLQNLGNPNNIFRQPTFAMGGNVPIEVEGDEVMQHPNGELHEVNGPTHEEGGVDVNVAKGTKIYSDRLSVDGNTMADRKKRREKTLSKLEKLTEDNTSTPLKNTLKRTAQIQAIEEAQDMAMQKAAKQIYGNVGEAAWGDDGEGMKSLMWPMYDILPPDNVSTPNRPLFVLPPRRDVVYPSTAPSFTKPANTFTPTGSALKKETWTTAPKDINIPDFPKDDKSSNKEGSGFTTGDYVGMAGNLFNAIAPIINTNNAARATKPNINRYRGFGRKAIEANDVEQASARQVATNAKTALDTSSNASYARNRGNANSVNTIRALDIASDIATNKARNQVDSSLENQMIAILRQRGQLENTKDQMEMQGQTATDIRDKQDIDNYFSNKAQNLTNFGTNIQGLGRNLNKNRRSRMDKKHINQLSQYETGFDDNEDIVTIKGKKYKAVS